MTYDSQQTLPRILVCTTDHSRLSALLESHSAARDSELLQRLEAELLRSEVVDPERLPADVVRMNSTVVFRDIDSGQRREYELVYPHEADLKRGRVSILAPVGCALLGLAVGQKVAWPLPDGRIRNFEVVSVSHPPDDDELPPLPDSA